MKKCSKCKKDKPLDSFFVSRKSRSKDGKHNVCKACSKEYHRQWRKKPESRLKAVLSIRKTDLKSKFGLTIEKFTAMLEKQDGRCAICGGYERTKGRNNLAIDHDHATGKIRGLLCGHCNKGLGLLQDSPQILKNALDYLKNQ